jgi:Protein of unknown function (DUF3303)
MKYVISFTARAGGSSAEIETGVERALAVFSKWTPPADQNITEFVNRIDGDGGFMVVETDNAASLLDGVSKFAPWFEFQVFPVVDTATSVQIAAEAVEFRKSIS